MQTKKENITHTHLPLYVDLDGTLIKSDMLYESVFSMLKVNFLYIFLLPFWLISGKSYLKEKIASKADINPELLPYNISFLNFLKQEYANGRRLILATASNKKFANEIADYLGIFSHVIASDGDINLSGHKKLSAILENNNGNEFSYAGNDNIDLTIFRKAKTAILVNSPKKLTAKTEKLVPVEQVFIEQANKFKSIVKAMRVHQWLKNLLIFVPLLTAQLLLESDMLLKALAGFFIFSLTASSVYLFNDMLDLDSDRNHPRKKNRAFASGELSLLTGSVLLVILPLISFVSAYFISMYFLYALAIYLAMTFAYSIILKTYVLIDVVMLASLYTIRVIAGAAIILVIPSFWLLAFSMFIFLSLALIKRCSELHTLNSMQRKYTDGRDYNVTDLPALTGMGIASGYISILVIAFFINSQDVVDKYSHPQLLWLLCPVLLYWISRIWLKTERGEMDDDPIVFSIKDRGSRYVAVFMVIIVLLAI